MLDPDQVLVVYVLVQEGHCFFAYKVAATTSWNA